MTNTLIYNGIKTPDGTIIESTHRHDFVCHTDKNGKRYCVDGGLEYVRRVFDKVADYEELSLYDDEPHDIQRQVLKWGTRGKEGGQPLKFIPIADLSTNHLDTLLHEYPGSISPVFRSCMKKEWDIRVGTSKE